MQENEILLTGKQRPLCNPAHQLSESVGDVQKA